MCERLVLAREGGRGYLRQHETGIHAAMLDEKRRQPGKRRIDEQRHSPLRERADLGDGNRQRIGRERNWLAVKVTPGEDLVADDERVIGDSARLALENSGCVAQLLEAGAHYLRLAAQAVWV